MSTKIIWGKFSGKKLISLKNTHIRPLTGKVKMSIFNVLFNLTDFSDLDVLDTFCGLGSFGIECLSLGANRVFFIDKNLNSIKKNLDLLGIKKEKAILMNKEVLEGMRRIFNKNFHIIFMDPPFDFKINTDYYEEANRLLHDNGMLIVRFGPYNEVLPENEFEIYKSKKHLPSKIYFFVKGDKI